MAVHGKAGPPADLKKFVERRLDVRLNGSRRVVGVLRGYDKLMNIILHDAIEIQEVDGSEPLRVDLGTVLLRGNSIKVWETIDRA